MHLEGDFLKQKVVLCLDYIISSQVINKIYTKKQGDNIPRMLHTVLSIVTLSIYLFIYFLAVKSLQGQAYFCQEWVFSSTYSRQHAPAEASSDYDLSHSCLSEEQGCRMQHKLPTSIFVRALAQSAFSVWSAQKSCSILKGWKCPFANLLLQSNIPSSAYPSSSPLLEVFVLFSSSLLCIRIELCI